MFDGKVSTLLNRDLFYSKKKMLLGTTILSITGSDSSGLSGMQADVRTISELGGHPLSAVTCIATQGRLGKQHVYDLPCEVVMNQVKSLMDKEQPGAIKVGLIRDKVTIEALGRTLKGQAHVVCAPGILTSNGAPLCDNETIRAFCQHIIPHAELLVTRCSEAEMMLDMNIASDEEMVEAAQALHKMGARWVMLRGGLQNEGCCTALLLGKEVCRFFSSYNVDGWLQHGVGGALSSAIATRIAMGDEIEGAISHAHNYIHSQVVYAVKLDSQHLRPSDFYNQLMSLIAEHYRTAHNVAFYADKLAISTRYLSQMTNKYVGKSPKEVIADYIMREAKIQLETSRLTIQEIAGMLGFATVASFCKFFKTQEGCTPSELRKSLLQ